MEETVRMRPFVLVLCMVLASNASAQLVEVFEKAEKPVFEKLGKNTDQALGYGYVVLSNGDSLKGTLRIDRKDGKVSQYVIRSKQGRFTYLPAAVKAYDFYKYRVFNYDPLLIGNPRFHPGYVITNSGVRVNGMVAVMTVMGTEWLFFPKQIYFIPDQSKIASSMSGGDLREVGQTTKEGLAIYDAFGDGYLQRIISGTLRLSYNPNPNLISKSLFHVQKEADSAQIKDTQKYIEASINEGKPLNEAIRSGKDVSSSLDLIILNTEIIGKEYFLTDTRTGKIHLVKETNYKSILEPMFAGCPAYVRLSEQNKNSFFNYRKIEDMVNWFNTNCK